MIDLIAAACRSIAEWRPIRDRVERRRDRERDRIIEGRLRGEKLASPLFDPEALGEAEARDSCRMSYTESLALVERLVEDSNRAGNRRIRVSAVRNVDRGAELFDTANGPMPKLLLQLGRAEDPRRSILFVTGTHGEESRLWRAALKACLRLARPGGERDRLLDECLVTFDPLADMRGADDQSRGYVSRDGMQVNEPLVRGRAHDANPFGLEDRNSEQGRNSEEARSVLTRSTHAAYRALCGDLDWIGDHHETNENSSYPSDFFRYGGIMLMPHLYLTNGELARLNKLGRCLTPGDRLRKLKSDWSPLAEPLFREQALRNHPTMRRIRAIRDRIRGLGQRTFESVFERALLLFPSVERDLCLDESIYVGGEMFRIPGILLGPDVLAPEGMTTETFQQDLVVRLRQTLAAMEAQLMVVGLGGDHVPSGD